MFDKFSKKIKMTTAGYILAALGLVAGLAWNDAIKSLIEYFYPAQFAGLPAKFLYAFVITIVVVLIGWRLNHEE